MRTIEPCCAKKQLVLLRDAIGQDGKTQFQGYGDLSLTELLPALLTHYSETEMLLAAPAIPDQAAYIILRWLRRTMARVDGRGTLDYIARLTIVADLSREASPVASGWLTDNPFADRLTLIDTGTTGRAIAPEDTALLLPDIAITGPLNLRYGQNFVCTATTRPDEVQALWQKHQEQPKAEEPEQAEPTKPAKAAKKPAKTKAAVETEQPTAEPQADSEQPSKPALSE